MQINRGVASATGLVAVMLVVAACGSSSAPSTATGTSASAGAAAKPELTLYNAQHEDLMKLMSEDFTKTTGIKVNMRNGEDLELGNQLVQEGAASPADVFVTENSPAMTNVDSKGLFAKVDDATWPRSRHSSPPQARTGSASRVARRCSSTTRPGSRRPTCRPRIMDLSQPKWKGKVGISPGGADFQAIVSAVLELKGEAATTAWLKGLKENVKAYQGNSAVLKAVNSGALRAA